MVEIVSDDVFKERLVKRLVSKVNGYYSLYSDHGNVLSETEITTLVKLGYQFNSVSVVNGEIRALFYKKE